MVDSPPTLNDWAGGPAALHRLTQVFYAKVAKDPLIGPVFAAMDPDHAAHVATFIAEVLGGPADYSAHGGGHARMIRRHMGRHLTEDMRRRWMALLMDAAQETGLPDDPEFRASFTGYLEWGSRLAVMNSADGAADPDDSLPMPAWNWTSPGGPYAG
jgi:hemoglobin